MTIPAELPSTTGRLRIEFLFLDLETCTRCRGTDRNLESALEAARELLAAAGTEVEVDKIHVESAAQARELRFVSSPTIRVNGRDIALELRESSCGSEACTDGCGKGIRCRVWVHHDREYTEPPVAMILDAILREVYRGPTMGEGEARTYRPSGKAKPYALPENLARYFADANAAQAEDASKACCEPAEQRVCCDPGDKVECCGTSPGEDCRCR